MVKYIQVNIENLQCMLKAIMQCDFSFLFHKNYLLFSSHHLHYRIYNVIIVHCLALFPANLSDVYRFYKSVLHTNHSSRTEKKETEN